MPKSVGDKEKMTWQRLTGQITTECGFVSGGRGSGKSRLSMLLTQLLLQDKVKVKVIDSSRTWIKYSSVPQYYKIKSPFETNLFAYWNMPNLWNCVYDCSRLSTYQLRELVAGMMASDFRDFVELDEKGFNVKACYILEEAQNLVPSGSLRSRDFAEISRFITQGRNFGLSYLAITQRLASVDASIVEISGLKFFGKTEGQNTVRKAKAWVPLELLKQSRDFKAGTFIMQYGSKATVERVPLFNSPLLPQEYIEPPPKPTLWQRIFGTTPK